MKVLQRWKRNTPDTVTGESITISFTYSSFDKSEIDELERNLPNGLIITDENWVCSNDGKSVKHYSKI